LQFAELSCIYLSEVLQGLGQVQIVFLFLVATSATHVKEYDVLKQFYNRSLLFKI
jgi:hypothetical protein